MEEGTKGVGACMIFSDWGGYPMVNDANLFGTVEATGDSGFKFLPKNKNHWDYNTGYTSASGTQMAEEGFMTMFVSNPLDLNGNSKKHLGIRDKKSYWKCYAGTAAVPDLTKPFDSEISLADFDTDKNRRVDA